MSETDVFKPQEPVEALDRKVWQRRAFAEYVSAMSAGDDVSVLMIDLSGFKDVNDEVGHFEGDETIEQVNSLLRGIAENFRQDDQQESDKEKKRRPDVIAFTHYQPALPGIEEDADSPFANLYHAGGDEWVILARTDERGVKAITERVRTFFDNFVHQPENRRLLEVGIGIAIGSSTIGKNDVNNFSDMLRFADRAMQQDKLDQLDFSEHQKRVIADTRAVLEAAGIRYRDAARYVRSIPKDETI